MQKLELRHLIVRPAGRTNAIIEWEFAPTVLAFNDFSITLERAEHSAAKFKTIAQINPNQNVYSDKTIRIFRFWENVTYRMKIAPNDGGEPYYTKSAKIEYTPSVVALEFIRRLHITLTNKSYGSGVACYAFIRKHGGTSCRECYDPLKKRVIKSHCLTCYTVGYEGGFYMPISLYVSFTPDQEQVVLTDRGSESNSRHNAYAEPMPTLSPGDLIYDKRLGRLWTVEGVSLVERRRHPVKQLLNLEEVERTSVFYNMCEEKLKNE